MIIDRLYEDAAKNGPVCLGLDTAPEYLPEPFAQRYETPAEAVLAYNRALIDVTADVVACYKVQIAYYEALGLPGLSAYAQTLRAARDSGRVVIADIKRGDIGATADMYAKAHFSGDFEADMVTLNPYLGMESLASYAPWLAGGKGCFILARTSNPGARDLQFRDVRIEAENGGESGRTERLYERVADLIRAFGEPFRGACGYTNAGAVVGATNPEENAALRARLDGVFLLIPGFGAQGGAARDAAALLGPDGRGGVVNSSRAILTAWRKREHGAEDFAGCARQEATAARDALRACL